MTDSAKTAGSFTAGVCVKCHRICETGKPDACLGVIPGVSHACCGHGDTEYAYVVLGGSPGQDCLTIPHTVALYGADAEAFFALIQRGVEVTRAESAEILDACCGGRMWWWDKAHPLAVYMDNRAEPKGANPKRPNWHIGPDVTGDFRAMPFADAAFRLVVFDPPHIVRAKPSGIYPLYYGALHPDTEQDDLRRGFAECWRVLAPGGTLIFKWAGPLDRVEPHFPATPIIGNRIVRASSGLGTRWIIFYKPLGAGDFVTAIRRGETTRFGETA